MPLIVIFALCSFAPCPFLSYTHTHTHAHTHTHTHTRARAHTHHTRARECGVCVCVCVCVSVCDCVCVCVCVCLSVCPSLCASVCAFLCLSAPLVAYLFTFLSFSTGKKALPVNSRPLRLMFSLPPQTHLSRSGALYIQTGFLHQLRSSVTSLLKRWTCTDCLLNKKGEDTPTLPACSLQL